MIFSLIGRTILTHADALIAAAYDYLGRGLRVIALSGKMPNGKVHPHWKDDCFVYADGQYGEDGPIEPAFRHPDTTGIGILTGMPYYVVDIDGELGAARWKEIAGDEFVPDRWVAQTGRRDATGRPNGLHIWVAYWGHFPTTKLGEKLDFKGDGGYVAAPPSIHPDSGEGYEWLLEPGANIPLEMPESLYAVLHAKQYEKERGTVARDIRRLQRHPYDPSEGMFFATETNFDGIIQKMTDEPEGNRSNVLYWAARTMLEEGADGADLEVLLDAAIAAGLGRTESRRTIRSAIDA